MEVSKRGLFELIGYEGICLSPYLDSVGVWTIGVGATKSEIPGLNGSHPDISLRDAIELFRKGILKYQNAVNKALKVVITQYQFDTLVSICYNIGTGGMAGSTFMKRVNARKSSKEVAEAILMWNKPPEIMGRRRKEAKLYSTGVYSNNGKALLFPVNSKHKPVYSKGKEIDLNDLL